MDQQKKWWKMMIFAALFNLAANFVLIQWFQANEQNGAVGAAVALLLTEMLNGIVGSRFCPKGRLITIL